MIKGFRDFLMRGNVVDLAVAVIIGAAFTSIVTALNTKVIAQLIAAVGGVSSMEDASFKLGSASIGYGAVVAATINFVIVAAIVYFFVVTPMNKLQERFNKPAEEKEATLSKDQELLIEIRDLLARR
ncbi:MAG: large conductance mechanosensitive channel protein MscL [Patulibacter minatonensis]